MKNTIEKTILSNKEASIYLGCSASSLKQSRVSGRLFGTESPAFLKMGYMIRYNLSTLNEWLSQFTEKKTTTN